MLDIEDDSPSGFDVKLLIYQMPPKVGDGLNKRGEALAAIIPLTELTLLNLQMIRLFESITELRFVLLESYEDGSSSTFDLKGDDLSAVLGYFVVRCLFRDVEMGAYRELLGEEVLQLLRDFFPPHLRKDTK